MNAKCMSRLGRAILMGLILLLGLAVAAGARDSETMYGHAIPPFKPVFVKFFHTYLMLSDLTQLRTVSAQLTDSERASITAFWGPEGHAQVKNGLTKSKKGFMDEKYVLNAGIPYEPDFHKVYPHILAVAGNGLSSSLWKQFLDGLTAEELASQSFWLNQDGRRILFTELNEDRVVIYIDHVQEWQIIAEGKRMLEGLKDYTTIMYKQERIHGKLQGVEKILLKYRDKPLGIYMKWLEGPWQGREVLYNSQIHKPGWARVRESGVLGVVAVTAPIDSKFLRRGTNHLLTEVGFRYYIERNEKEFLKVQGREEFKRYGIKDLNGVKVYQFESILPKGPDKYYAYRTMECFDYRNALPVKSEIYNFDNEVKESFYYTQIKVNPGLNDYDFDPANSDYRLK